MLALAERAQNNSVCREHIGVVEFAKCAAEALKSLIGREQSRHWYVNGICLVDESSPERINTWNGVIPGVLAHGHLPAIVEASTEAIVSTKFNQRCRSGCALNNTAFSVGAFEKYDTVQPKIAWKISDTSATDAAAGLNAIFSRSCV